MGNYMHLPATKAVSERVLVCKNKNVDPFKGE